MKRSMAVLVLAGVAAAACSRGGPGADEATLRVEGTATVVDAAGETRTVTDESDVDFGDTVTIDSGTGSLELANGARFEFRSGDPGSKVRVGAIVEILEGDVLVASGVPGQVRFEDVTLRSSGAMAVDADDATAVVYTGRTTVSGLGSVSAIEALRGVVLTRSAKIEPITYDASDPWDREFLGEAISFGQRLEALARGYTTDLQPSGGKLASFFSAVIPALADEREFKPDLLDDRPSGETLVGAVIAVQGQEGNFRDRWRAVFSFRDQGAAWGLVALDQGVSSAPVLETIEAAISESPLSNQPRPTTSTTVPVTPTTTPGGSTPPPTSPPTTQPPSPPTTQPPVGGLLDPVLDPVDALLDDVLGLLGLGG